MKAIVCVKQVPDTSGKVAVKADGTMDRASMATITNPDDMNAIEAALKLKDETGCEVTVVSMGPPPAEGMLRELLAMGADKAVLVSGREFGGSDTYATSRYPGRRAEEDRRGRGLRDHRVLRPSGHRRRHRPGGSPDRREKLNLPQVTYVSEIKAEGKKIDRAADAGGRLHDHRGGAALPADLHQGAQRAPLHERGRLMVEAYSKPYEVYEFNTLKDDPLIDLDTIGLKGSPPPTCTSPSSPPVKGAGMMLEGADKATCDKLVSLLDEKHLYRSKGEQKNGF